MSTTTAAPSTKTTSKRSIYFVVTLQGDVYRAATKKAALHAADLCGGYEVTEQEVVELPMGALVAMYNRARPDKPITKFRDRDTAARALSGVLDFLGKPMPSHLLLSGATPAPNTGAKTKGRGSAARKPNEDQVPMTAETTAKKRGPKKRDIPQELIDQIVALRNKNVSWAVALRELGLPLSFVHRVRAELKKINPSLVKPLGPGSPNYGTAKVRRAEAKTRVSDIPQEAF